MQWFPKWGAGPPGEARSHCRGGADGMNESVNNLHCKHNMEKFLTGVKNFKIRESEAEASPNVLPKQVHSKARKYEDAYLVFGFTVTTVGNGGGHKNVLMYQRGAQQRMFAKHCINVTIDSVHMMP